MIKRIILLCFCLFMLTVISCTQKDTLSIGVCCGLDRIEQAKEGGADFVEIGIRSVFIPDKSDDEFSVNLQKAKESPLPLTAGNVFFPGSIKLVGAEANELITLEYAETAFRRAQQTGTKLFVLGSGGSRRIPEGFSPEKAFEQFVSLCKKMASIAAKYDVTIVLEPLHSAETNFINTVREGMRIIKAVNHPNMCILADFYHMAKEDEDADAILEAGSWLKHCHIAQEKDRAAPGVNGEDFTPYLRALKRINYQGSISIECRWKSFGEEIAPAIAEVRRQMSLVY